MGLIRKAAIQGKQAIESILAKKNYDNDYDVIIVGAGPADFRLPLLPKNKDLIIPNN